MDDEHKLFGYNFKALWNSCKRECHKKCTGVMHRCVGDEQKAYDECEAKCDGKKTGVSVNT